MVKIRESIVHCSQLKIAFKITIVVFILVHCAKCNPLKSSHIDLSDLKLINEAAEWFPPKEPLTGYEVVLRRYNHSIDTTVYMSVHIPDHQILHNRSDDNGKKLVVLPGQTETLKVPYKNITTYLVLRQVPGRPDRYTSHLAYFRKFSKEKSIEWDLYSFHFHHSNGNFLSAFFPIRGGPAIISLGIGETQTRSKRGGTGDCSVVSFYLGRCKSIDKPEIKANSSAQPISSPKGSQIPADQSQIQRPSLQLQGQRQFQTTASEKPRPTGPQKLQWSWKTTERAPLKSAIDKKFYELEEKVTEFPMYGDIGKGNGLDDFGFTTLPPWSEFRQFEATTEMNDPFGNGIPTKSSKPKKVCFGLERNCIDRPSKKPVGGKKACPFGHRCKDKSFLDRYAVVTTTTTPAPNDEETGGKKPKTKKNKKTKEQCETEAATNKGHGKQSSNGEDPCAQYNIKPTAGEADMAIEDGEDHSEPGTDLSSLVGGAKGTANSNDESKTKEEKTKKPQIEGITTTHAQQPANPFANSLKAEPSNSNAPVTDPPWFVQGGLEIYQPPSEPGSEPREDSGYGGKGFEHDGTMEGDLQRKRRSLITENDGDEAVKSIMEIKNENPLSTNIRKRRNVPNQESFEKGLTELISLTEQKRNVRQLPENINDLDFPIEQILTPGHREKREQESTLEKFYVPFVGVGDCPYIPQKDSKHPSSEADVIDFYLEILKVHCHPSFKEQTQKLFKTKLVVGDKAKPLRISLEQDNPLVRKKTLGENEWLDLSSAIFLSEFSNVYADQYEKYLGKNTDHKSPDGQPISGTVKTMTLLSLRILELTKSPQKINAVKLSNALLVALQAQKSEIVTALDDLEKCSSCELEKKFNFNDQLQLNALMRFIVDKLGEIVTAGNDKIETIFNQFYTEYLHINAEHVTNKNPFVF